MPVGAGLSSSAALEVATYTFLEAMTGCFTKKLEDKVIIIYIYYIIKKRLKIQNCKNINGHLLRWSEPRTFF